MNAINEKLCIAAAAGELQVVKSCLDAGADIHTDEDLALRWAVEFNRLEVVQYLLAAGADVDAKDEVPLSLAASRGHLAVLQCLIAAGANLHTGNEHALQLAAGKLNAVKSAIAAGADVQAEGNLALQSAASAGHLDVVRHLLEAGADVSAGGDAPLRMAAEYGHEAIVRVLRAHGARLGVQPLSFPDMTPSMQVAIFELGAVDDLSAADLVRQGVCLDALYVLLKRQGSPALAELLRSTQVLVPLDADSRADMLAEMLMRDQPEAVYARP